MKRCQQMHTVRGIMVRYCTGLHSRPPEKHLQIAIFCCDSLASEPLLMSESDRKSAACRLRADGGWHRRLVLLDDVFGSARAAPAGSTARVPGDSSRGPRRAGSRGAITSSAASGLVAVGAGVRRLPAKDNHECRPCRHSEAIDDLFEELLVCVHDSHHGSEVELISSRCQVCRRGSAASAR